jgi:hypothetical protein
MIGTGFALYIDRKREFKMIGFFDFDMTTAITKGKETPSFSQFKNPEFAVEDILNAKPTKITKSVMNRYKKVFILTARNDGKNNEMSNAMQKYFMQNGIYIPNNQILMLGDYMKDRKTAEKKSVVLNRLSKHFKQTIHFWDDDNDNVRYAKCLDRVKTFQV